MKKRLQAGFHSTYLQTDIFYAPSNQNGLVWEARVNGLRHVADTLAGIREAIRDHAKKPQKVK